MTMRTRHPSRPFSLILHFLRPHRFRFCIAMGALCVSSAANLAMPELARRGLSAEQLPKLADNLSLGMLLLAALFFVQGMSSFLRSYLFNLIGHRVFAQVREELFDAILSRHAAFFDGQRAGELASRINSDAALVQEAVSVKASVLIRYTIQVVCGIVLMVWMSWRLTAAIVVSLVIVIGVSALYSSRLRAAAREYQHQLARLVGFATEIFGAARVVQALAAQREVLSRYTAQNHEALTAGERRGRVGAAFASGASLLLNLLLVAVVWYGVALVVKGELPLNDLAAFVLYGGIVAASSAFLVGAYTDLLQSLGGLERVFELMIGARSVARGAAPPQPPHTSRGARVEFHNVVFRYASDAPPDAPPDASTNGSEAGQGDAVLKGVSLELRPASTTALVGPSGSGKSSLVALLLRFYTPQSGAISIDGVPLHDISEEELRAAVTWVPHDPPLFALSLRDNLLLGNSSVPFSRVDEVVASWPFMEFVRDLPRGIDTVIGENGVQLSAGQRQRVAIARALLRRPRLLILDEATSGLDSESEESVFRVVREWLPEVTLLVISHRIATVREAARTYVIQDGQVIQDGTHDELKGTEGLYRQYVERQAVG